MAEPGGQKQRGEQAQIRRRVAVALLVVLLLGIASRFVEWVDEPVDYGYGPEARSNPLLAAELLLEAAGKQAESVRGLDLLDALPPTTDLIVMSASRYALSARRVEALRDWVFDGGHLVVVAEEPYDWDEGSNPDSLLASFDFYLDRCADDADEVEETAAEEGDDLAADAEALDEEAEEEIEPIVLGELLREELSGELPVCWEDRDRLARITLADGRSGHGEFDTCPVLVDARVELEEDELATGYVVYGDDFGEGEFIAANTLGVFYNERIHCADHAYMLLDLARHREKIWLLADPAVPGIVQLAWAAAPISWAGFGVWIALWVAARSLPLGVAAPEASTDRRALIEQLEASADFSWRMGLGKQALEPLRADVIARARRHSPGIEHAASAAQVKRIAEITGVSLQRVHLALAVDPGDRRAQWSEIVRTLIALRRQL